MTFAPPTLGFIGYEDPPEPAEARALVLPLPYDLTTTYQPGTRNGPLAILTASQQVEWYDDELGIETAAVGIATLPPVAPDASGPAVMLRRVREVASDWVHPDRLLVAVGGEHSLTAPLVAAHRELYPDLVVLQVDAHADLRDSWEGTGSSHACVMRRVMDMEVPIVQVGIRSLTRQEHDLIRAGSGVTTVFARDVGDRPAREWAGPILDRLSAHVYVTVDVDGLDSSVMPATGTPEPGGLSWRQLVDLLRLALDGRRLVGADVCELAPIPGLVAPDFLVARLVYRLIGLAALERGWAAAAG